VTLSPVVTSTVLTEDKVIGAEDLTIRTSTDRVHSTGFKIEEDSAGDIATTSGFVVVNVDAFKLEIGVTMVGTSGVDTVFVADDFPELSTDLVTALTGLDMNNFTPEDSEKYRRVRKKEDE
jgi:hypothetical protein